MITDGGESRDKREVEPSNIALHGQMGLQERIVMCEEKESTPIQRLNWRRSRERQKRIEDLEERIWKILEVDFSTPIDSEKMGYIRMEEKVINSGLAALRLQQGEHRLANNLAIAILTFLSAIAGGIVGYMLH